MEIKIKVAIVGSRTFSNYDGFEKNLKDTIRENGWMDIELISGGAKGADSMAQRYAKENGLKITIFYPNWNKYGNSAGFQRNRLIIEACDVVVAWWDNKSKGTQNSLELAEEMGKKKIVFIF